MDRPNRRPSVAPTPLREATRRRVLLVDDDREVRGAIADLLLSEGFDVTEAEHGLEALLQLRTAVPCPDVVVLDLVMPVMSGWEFREAQLADPAIADIPVIVLSSRPAGGLPFAARLQKPCPPEALLETLRRVLSVSPGGARRRRPDRRRAGLAARSGRRQPRRLPCA
jgi:CheY-like chemotaxis protein